MYSDWSVIASMMAAVFLWLGILSFFVWRESNFLSRLFPQSGERDIRKKFEEILKQSSGFDQKLDGNNKKLDDIFNQGLKHIQKVKLIRYNPYQETGGDQSFSLALLDKKNNGVVITSLHNRAGTRVFAKPVKEGREDGFEFSDEERQVIRKA